MRAKDLHMAATIDDVERVIYLTGAIDRNDTRICMEIELPDAGQWRLIKSETNLTEDAWTSWLISMGEGMNVRSPSSGGRLSSRQFQESVYYEDLNSFCFYGGTVRPGEPVVKVMDFETDVKYVYASHGRCAKETPALVGGMSDQQLREAFERELEAQAHKPTLNIKAATHILPSVRMA